MIKNILTPVIAMAALGLVFGLGLAYALKLFRIEVDPKIFKILSMLPGTNCGSCGKAGCAGFAEALAKGEAIPSGCVVSNNEARKALAELLGLTYDANVKMVATVLCNGGTRALDKYKYNGIKSCRAAALIFGGPKACAFGCIGLGDCAEACPFDAISMGPDNIPIIDPEKCTACGKCVKACPKNLYRILPMSVNFYVKCSSGDSGGATMKVCKAGCIACMKCVKACPAGAPKVESNLSKIDAEKCKNLGKCFDVCPTKVITKRQ